jgi:hypothetical protein
MYCTAFPSFEFLSSGTWRKLEKYFSVRGDPHACILKGQFPEDFYIWKIIGNLSSPSFTLSPIRLLKNI